MGVFSCMDMRTIFWDYEKNELKAIDQRKLPGRFEVATLRTCADTAEAIRNMTVRGAPAIGAAAAFGMALSAFDSTAVNGEMLYKELESAGKALTATRPTAVNLRWAVERMMKFSAKFFEQNISVEVMKKSILQEAQNIADEDVQTNRKMAEYGETLIDDGDTIIHHCNTGSLATVDWGTALGVIRMAWEKGKHVHVLVDETRPRLQGARLTAWELEQYGIPYEIITDNMAGHFLASGEVRKVLFGADRIAANGDVANKVGTYMLALAAHYNGIPVYSVAPTTTIDMTVTQGNLIPIEERNINEVLDIQLHGEQAVPEKAKARNPAFDVTPNRLITAIVTEKGIVRPPYEVNLQQIFSNGMMI